MSADPRLAATMALDAHNGQRYGELPYAAHLGHVVAVLLRFGHNAPALLAAAWLHDTLEDTALPRERIAEEQGQTVLALVEAVTDGPGNRRGRLAGLIARMAAIGDDDLRHHAITLKVADRIANVEASLMSGGPLLEMYRGENPAFCSGLVRLGGDAGMWHYLNRTLRSPGTSRSPGRVRGGEG